MILYSGSLAPSNQEGIALPPYYIKKFEACYEGDWKNKRPNGIGKLYFQNGSYFEGPFNNGDITGDDGIFIYPDGSFKRGHISNGKMEGEG
jgi:hypothetical protein